MRGLPNTPVLKGRLFRTGAGRLSVRIGQMLLYFCILLFEFGQDEITSSVKLFRN
jgi:hypothetical protein